ncbi:epoxide hydrolase [Favolaschia claudopus]|uniref:Epoxide hydrolase n=1 Tax=Favolaschia claudopus TaxID=2862362 RepID=A0AAW0DR87_9AGAR
MPKVKLPSGHTWAYVDANPQGTTTILCLHGFPDLGFGYRHQIGPWAKAGFRVVVPDMLGYGGSSAPIDPSQYTTKRLANDLAELLTALGVSRAIVVGHDWGSFTAARMALWQPNRVLALVLMSVPYTPPALAPTSLFHIAARAPNLAYQLFLASPEAAPVLEANLPRFLALTFQSPSSSAIDFTGMGAMRAQLTSTPSPTTVSAIPCVLKGDALRAYLAAFRAHGLTGPTNYYRTARTRSLEEISNPTLALSASLDVLSIYGTLDPTIAPAALKAQRRFVSRLTEMPLKGTGHWVMVEDVREEPQWKIGGAEDPLEEWREHLSSGGWKEGDGDGGAVGRTVLTWLKGLGITSVQKTKL